MDIEAIILKAQKRAQKIANKVERALRKDSELDPQELATRFAEMASKKSENNVETYKPIRLTLENIEKIYSQTGLTPGNPHYFFADDFPKNPLIQVVRINHLTNQATPIGALCIASRKDIIDGIKTVPDYIYANSKFVEEPSNKWYLGQISQITGLSCSYILGFEHGYGGNAKLHKNCSLEAHMGYGDGRENRKIFLEKKLLLEQEDQFLNETDPQKLSELYRIGYYEEIDDNSNQ